MQELVALLRAADRVVALHRRRGVDRVRDPGLPLTRGVWTKYDPMDFTFDRYVASAAVRANAWAMRRELFGTRVVPERRRTSRSPARGGRAARLGVITQNIDGLHQDAGSSGWWRCTAPRAR